MTAAPNHAALNPAIALWLPFPRPADRAAERNIRGDEAYSPLAAAKNPLRFLASRE